MSRRQTDELWPACAACYAVPVVRGSPNPRYFGLSLRLKQTREQAGLTRQELAQKVGGSHATVSYLESGDRWPSVGTTLRLAIALSVSPGWLAYGLGERCAECSPAAIEGMGERLQAARTERGLSKATLASAASLNPGSILGIERGAKQGLIPSKRWPRCCESRRPGWPSASGLESFPRGGGLRLRASRPKLPSSLHRHRPDRPDCPVSTV